MVDIGFMMVCLSGPHFDPGVVTVRDGDTPTQIERTRIQRHLANVEVTLRARSTPTLDAAQRAARSQALDALHEYWQAGRFPRNVDFIDRRVPYFIDDEGTACAVGHLMIESGAAELAREIATYENNDFVAEIGHPGVGAWLDRSGFTAAEAAWIQPAYGPCGFGDQPLVCGVDGNTYLCEYIAVECAGVAVAYEGACGDGTTGDETGTGGSSSGSSSSGDGTTGGDVVIGEEICPVGTTSEGGDETSSGSEGSTSVASTTSAPESTGPESSGPTDDEQGDDKGCSCDAGGRPGGALGSLILFAWLGRRRRGARASSISA